MLINSRAVARKAGGSVKWDDHDDGDFDQEDVDDEPGDDRDDVMTRMKMLVLMALPIKVARRSFFFMVLQVVARH